MSATAIVNYKIKLFSEDDNIMNENSKVLLCEEDTSLFSNPIPQSFDLFLNDLTTKSRVSSAMEEDVPINSKRSLSEINLTTVSAKSAANLLEIITSSPLKKDRFFSSNDQDLAVMVQAKEEILTDESEEEEEEELKPVLNLTYTSLNTNEEQFEQDIRNQSPYSLGNKMQVAAIATTNLNRTFCKDDNSTNSKTLTQTLIKQL